MFLVFVREDHLLLARIFVFIFVFFAFFVLSFGGSFVFLWFSWIWVVWLEMAGYPWMQHQLAGAPFWLEKLPACSAVR